MSGKAPTIKLEFSNRQYAYITDIVMTGMYGDNHEAVLKHLIVRGIEDVVRAGIIKIEHQP